MEDFDIEYVNSEGQSLLHVACKEGHRELVIEIFELLNDREKIYNIINKEDLKSWTGIYYAIDASESGFPDIVGNQAFLL